MEHSRRENRWNMDQPLINKRVGKVKLQLIRRGFRTVWDSSQTLKKKLKKKKTACAGSPENIKIESIIEAEFFFFFLRMNPLQMREAEQCFTVRVQMDAHWHHANSSTCLW